MGASAKKKGWEPEFEAKSMSDCQKKGIIINL